MGAREPGELPFLANPTPRGCAITRGESGSAAARRTRSTPTHLRGAGAAGRRAERGPLTAPRPRVSPHRCPRIRRQAKCPGPKGVAGLVAARHRPYPPVPWSLRFTAHPYPFAQTGSSRRAGRGCRVQGDALNGPGPKSVPSSRGPPPCTRSVPPARSLTSPRGPRSCGPGGRRRFPARRGERPSGPPPNPLPVAPPAAGASSAASCSKTARPPALHRTRPSGLL